MSVIDEIASINASSFTDDEKRQRIYARKVGALLDVIGDMLGREIVHGGLTFRINSAHATPEQRLALNVTFTRPPAQSVTHQIFITNPPLLPRERTGNERNDMTAVISEMMGGCI